MSHSFQNIKIGLLVGIGRGAPSQSHDIRLGDVVVSTSGNKAGGVIQYGLGKKNTKRNLSRYELLESATAVSAYGYKWAPGQIRQQGPSARGIYSQCPEEARKITKEYQRPHPCTDKLYKSDIVHVQGDQIGGTTESKSTSLSVKFL